VSLLASYFVASRHQADAISRGERPSQVILDDGPALLPTDLGDLQRRLIGRESWSLIGDSDEEWLVQVGDDFTAKIASLPDPIGDEVADEFQLSADEVDAVEIMRPLAVRADSSSGLAVYILITL
jgi:hypothetical protein